LEVDDGISLILQRLPLSNHHKDKHEWKSDKGWEMEKQKAIVVIQKYID